jgi:hypothetical protein
LFSEAMASYSAARSPPLLAAYDFGSFRLIGGGTGRLIADILAAHPRTRGILFDLPHVVAGAPPLLAASGVEARCEVVGGSFFDGVPPGADAYMMVPVLHDWDDERSIAILKSIRKAMAEDAIVLIMVNVLPEKAEAGTAVDSYLLDLEMLVNTPGGRERSKSEFSQVLKPAGFGPPRLIQTTTA